MANGDNCKSCFENYCNQKSSFPTCYDTEAKEDQTHTNLEINASPKICANYNDMCFVLVNKDETVIRGCIEEYAAQNDLSSNFLLESGISSRTYRVCSTPLCNDDQVEPLFCLSCNYNVDKNCSDPLQMEDYSKFRKKCSPELTPSGCYHFMRGELFTERGCMAELEESKRQKCESDDDECKICMGNECNNKKEFLRCFDQEPNADATSLPSTKLCRRYNDKCFVHASNEEVQRGCLSHFIESPVSVEITADCLNMDSDVCETCSESLCNDRVIENEHCIVCASTVDDFTCIDNPTDAMLTKCPMAVKKLGCYFKLQDDIATRDCVFQLNTAERNECNQLGAQCKTCTGDGCNKELKFQKCIDCSSENDGADCISIASKLNTRLCPNDADQCYTHIQNGIVRRNCTGDNFIESVADCASDSEHCVSCSGWMCNRKVIEPEICLSCDSKSDPECASSMFNRTEECPISIFEDGCYHFIENKSDGRHKRGKFGNAFIFFILRNYLKYFLVIFRLC